MVVRLSGTIDDRISRRDSEKTVTEMRIRYFSKREIFLSNFFCSVCFASCAVNFDLFILRVCLGASLFVFYTSFAKLHVVVLFRFNVCVCVNLSHSYVRQKREEFSLDTMCNHKVLRYSYNSRLFFVLLAKISHILIVSRRYVYE